MQTYCQSNWCPPRSPAVGWIRPSASEGHSSPDPGRTSAFSPLWFQLQTIREMVTNRFDWAVVSSVDYDSSTDAACEVTQLLPWHISSWYKSVYCIVMLTCSVNVACLTPIFNNTIITSFDVNRKSYNCWTAAQCLCLKLKHLDLFQLVKSPFLLCRSLSYTRDVSPRRPDNQQVRPTCSQPLQWTLFQQPGDQILGVRWQSVFPIWPDDVI